MKRKGRNTLSRHVNSRYIARCIALSSKRAWQLHLDLARVDRKGKKHRADADGLLSELSERELTIRERKSA